MYSQVTINNIQVASTIVSVDAATSNDPNSYVWSEVSNTKQGVHISLIPPETGEIYLQLNNSWINFNTWNWGYMTALIVSYDGGTGQYIFINQTKDATGWIQSPFTSLGYHTISLTWYDISGNSYSRAYNVYVVPQSQKFYEDNYGNTLTMWDGGNSSRVILISEGFDPYNATYSEYLRYKGTSLFDPLIQAGYKLYFLNYAYNSQDMRNSAAIFNSASKYISHLNSNQTMVAAGVSMGGVIVRYALAKAENDGSPLPFNKFVSIDAPQQGAVFDRPLQDFFAGQSISDFQRHGLKNIAAEQLLTYNAYNSLYTSFYNGLNSLNNGKGYPTLTENIGISFSNNTPNPGNGRWVAITFNLVLFPGNYIYKTSDLYDEIKVPGSYLPRSLVASDLTPFMLGMVTVERDPNNNPTFVPYTSSLDIVNGVSRFNKKFQANSNYFHDQFPPEVVLPLLKEIIPPSKVIFQNKFVGLGNGGTISVNNSQISSPTSPYTVSYADLISATAIDQNINGIYYYLSNWTDTTNNIIPSTNNTITFSPTLSMAYIANFIGYPYYNISFGYHNTVNQPIQMYWTDNPNPNVTYQIWRNIKGGSGPVLLATVGRGIQSYTDYDYLYTRTYTNDLLYYDVREYYSVERTYSNPTWHAVYGKISPNETPNKNLTLSSGSENIINYFLGCYPNPFNPTTNIHYELPNNGLVTLKVYDELGREVKILVNQCQTKGRYDINFNADNFASGIYFYSLQTGSFFSTKKMLLLK